MTAEQKAEIYRTYARVRTAREAGWRVRYAGETRRGHRFQALSRTGKIVAGAAAIDRRRAYKNLLTAIDNCS